MELAGERRLVRIAAFERQFAQRGVSMLQPIAGTVDAQPRQILPGGEAEQRPYSLIELEGRKAGSSREIWNAQGLTEMVVDIGERR
jgi:hypothetical protein